MARVNPFRPNSRIGPGMFVGLAAEIAAIDEALNQTRAGFPKSFMITGERGIGKTSLLLYLKALATNAIDRPDDPFDFLVLETDIVPRASPWQGRSSLPYNARSEHLSQPGSF